LCLLLVVNFFPIRISKIAKDLKNKFELVKKY
jgi:hypothetical protein